MSERNLSSNTKLSDIDLSALILAYNAGGITHGFVAEVYQCLVELRQMRETRHKNDRVNYETTDDGFRICRGHHERSAGCEWEYFVPRPTHEPADALQSVQTMFRAAVSSLAEISQALDIPDHVASVANGNAEILKAIAHLKRASSPPSGLRDQMWAYLDAIGAPRDGLAKQSINAFLMWMEDRTSETKEPSLVQSVCDRAAHLGDVPSGETGDGNG